MVITLAANEGRFSPRSVLSQRSDFSQYIHLIAPRILLLFGLVLGNSSGNVTYSERHL